MERTLKGDVTDAHFCSTCLDNQLASHAVTDAKQTEEGGWVETAPRYGCSKHPVESNVILLDGTVIPYVKYHVN